MATGGNEETVEMLRLKLHIEQEKTKQIIEQKIIVQEKTKQIIEQEKTKRLQITETEKSKRLKLSHYPSSTPSTDDKLTLLSSYVDFYNTKVHGHIDSFDMDWLLKQNNNHFNDDIINSIEYYLDHVSLSTGLKEDEIQVAFDKLMINLLQILNDSTSLRYLSTHGSHYLQGKYRPDCSFIFKNININVNKENQCLQDFIVCLGELKSPKVSISDKSVKGQILQYLQTVLNVQNRQKIYGFLTNFTYITFFYVEKEQRLDQYNYFKSQDLKMFHHLSENSSTINSTITTTTTTANESRRICLDKDTWIIFTKFLIMNTDFYEYRTLNINPLDDLFGDKYHFKTKLGQGLTSKVYLLEKNNSNDNPGDFQECVIKILKQNVYSAFFLNEEKITQELKQLNISNKFNLFFEDILYSSPTGKFLIFQNQLKRIHSLSLIQSKQLIDIIQYLYESHIIHRDLRPQNIMISDSCKQLKLIDFGFAIKYIVDENEKTSIAGTITYAGNEFLSFYSNLSFNSLCTPHYHYEQSFDMKCAINIIVYMNDNEIQDQIHRIETLSTVQEKTIESLKLWKDALKKKQIYSNLLHLINDLVNGQRTFDAIKEQLNHLYNL